MELIRANLTRAIIAQLTQGDRRCNPHQIGAAFDRTDIILQKAEINDQTVEAWRQNFEWLEMYVNLLGVHATFKEPTKKEIVALTERAQRLEGWIRAEEKHRSA